MEKYSEPEREKQDVTSMSMEERLLLLESVDIESPCPKCGFSDWEFAFEEQNTQLFLHCRCYDCGHEWVE